MRKMTVYRLAAVCLLVALIGALLCGCAKKDDEDDKLFAYSPNGGKAFQTNLSGSSKKVMQTEIVIEVSSEKTANKFEEQDYKICNAVLMELRSVTEDKLKEADIQKTIGQELKIIINETMDTDSVKNVYFKSFVVA